LGGITFVLPGFFPHSPIGLKALVALHCPIFAVKLLDMHIDPAHWRERRIKDWLIYLPNPLLIVHRDYRLPCLTPLSQNAKHMARAVIQIGIGVAVLIWAFKHDLGGCSFWLDHAVKLAGVYLCAFDGHFVFLCALIRLLGVPVRDFSRHPIAAVTPADFWRRYNRDAGRFFHEDVFKPVGGLRWPVRGIMVVFFLNGLLHEYLAWQMTERITGYQMLFFMLNGLAVAATFRYRPRGLAQTLLARVATLGFFYFTTVLFFASVNQFLHWYSRGGVLP